MRFAALALTFFSVLVYAGPDRVLDGQKLKNGPVTWTLPTSDGAATQCLKTDGNRGLSFQSCAGSGGGSVSSVAQSVPSFLTISGSPVTSTGTLAIGLASQNQNLVFAGPSSGSGEPSFRSLVASDIPVLSYLSTLTGDVTTAGSVASVVRLQGRDMASTAPTEGQVIAWNSTTSKWEPKSAAGGVTSVALSMPSVFSVSGSPITSSGTISVNAAAQALGTVWAGPVSGPNAPPTFRALQASDLPALPYANNTLSNLSTTAITQDLNLPANAVKADALEVSAIRQPGGGANIIDVAAMQLQDVAGNVKLGFGQPSLHVKTNMISIDGNFNIGDATGSHFSNLYLGNEIRNANGDALVGLSGANLQLGQGLLSFPNSDGTLGQCLKTDGAGVLSFGACGAGGGGTWGSITGTLADQTDLQSALNGKQPTIAVGNNEVVGTDGTGAVVAVPGWGINAHGGLDKQLTVNVNGLTQSNDTNFNGLNVTPLQNSPNESVSLVNNQIALDPTNTGFQMGTGGTAVRVLASNISHQGTGDAGVIEFMNNNFSLGNGTDPVDVKGFGYAFGFGQVNANVNISGAMQGYGFQPNVNSAATISNSSYTQAFYDTATIATASPNYISFIASPSITEIQNNSNYQGFIVNPTIPTFTGNAGYTGLGVFGQLGDFGTGGFTGVDINPNIGSAHNAIGVRVNMDNVVVFPGAASSLAVQDLTLTMNTNGDNNAFTITYVNDATAGSEIADFDGVNVITVHIESGVSTASQVKAAIEANVTLNSNLTVTVSGTASNPQVTQVATNFAGGVNPGTKKAMDIVGDVSIDGDLAFTGGLSIGQLQAFYTAAAVNGGGQPLNMQSLTTALNFPANTTTANVDAIGVNNAMLINLAENSINTSGPFKLGAASVVLPDVVQTHTGSSLDYMNMGVYALNLDPGSTGGTIDTVNGVRVEAIPNGITTVNKFHAFEFNQTFGQVGTDVWGLHVVPTYAQNFIGGSLNVGSPTEKVSNSSVGIEIGSTTQDLLLSRLTTVQENALTALNGMLHYNTDMDKFRCYQNGAWTDCIGAGGGGADTALSNLTTTNLNQDLLFNTGALAHVKTVDVSATTASQQMRLRSGDNNGNGNSGSVFVISGDVPNATTGTRTSGSANLFSGFSSKRSGNVFIQSGEGGTLTGNVNIRSGSATPALGGSTGNILIQPGIPDGAGTMGVVAINSNHLTLGAIDSVTTPLEFTDSSGGNYVGFRGPASVPTSLIWTLPSADGTSGQVLSTDGSGVLSWASPGGGGGIPKYANFAALPAGANHDLAITSDTGDIYYYTTDDNTWRKWHNINPGTLALYDGAGAAAIVHTDTVREVRDELSNTALSFLSTSRLLYDSAGTPAMDFGVQRLLTDNAGNTALSFSAGGRALKDDGGNDALLWAADVEVYTNTDAGTARSLNLWDGEENTFVSIKAPDTGLSQYSVTLPDIQGENGQAMFNNGSGVLSWAYPSRIVAQGSAPSAGANLANAGSAATCNVTLGSTDTAGEIEFTPDTGVTNGEMCAISFNNAFPSKSFCTLTPSNADAADPSGTGPTWYVTSTNALFSLNFNNGNATLSPATLYKLTYHCIGQ